MGRGLVSFPNVGGEGSFLQHCWFIQNTELPTYFVAQCVCGDHKRTDFFLKRCSVLKKIRLIRLSTRCDFIAIRLKGSSTSIL